KEDIYSYAQNLMGQCLKKDGGQLSGLLKAGEASLEERCLRNICIASSLPKSGANGDICIIVNDPNSKKLGECIPGDIMLIEEYSSPVAYLVVATDYHKSDTVTLVRKDLAKCPMCFDFRNRGKYELSDIDILLEGMYVGSYENPIKEALSPVPLENNFYRHCFLLSYKELEEIEHFKDVGRRIANLDDTTTPATYITRELNHAKAVYSVKNTGEFSTVSQSEQSNFRPAIVLPSDLCVTNCQYGDTFAVKLPETKCGIYVMAEGEWKECM
ncbi:MAG: hypothetical protein IJZ81_05180, partial [Clostridia bacterium]|nr:hypothetical protein [Clostridia bacterium]